MQTKGCVSTPVSAAKIQLFPKPTNNLITVLCSLQSLTVKKQQIETAQVRKDRRRQTISVRRKYYSAHYNFTLYVVQQVSYFQIKKAIVIPIVGIWLLPAHIIQKNLLFF